MVKAMKELIDKVYICEEELPSYYSSFSLKLSLVQIITYCRSLRLPLLWSLQLTSGRPCLRHPLLDISQQRLGLLIGLDKYMSAIFTTFYVQSERKNVPQSALLSHAAYKKQYSPSPRPNSMALDSTPSA